MKVTRKQLFKKLVPFFEGMGYTYFKDTISPACGLFAKKIDDNIYVCIGIDTSNLFENAFDCNYYMGQSLTYALLYEGIRDAYLRSWQLFSEGELNKYRSIGAFSEDFWWHSDDVNSIKSFKDAVQLTEPRFINNLGLRERIATNEEAKHQHDLTTKVRTLVQSGVPDFETKFVPEKEKDGIPLIWFTAAEYVQKDEGYFNKNTVFRLTADAYRQYVLDEVTKSSTSKEDNQGGQSWGRDMETKPTKAQVLKKRDQLENKYFGNKEDKPQK